MVEVSELRLRGQLPTLFWPQPHAPRRGRKSYRRPWHLSCSGVAFDVLPQPAAAYLRLFRHSQGQPPQFTSAMSDIQLYLFEYARNKDEAARIAAQSAERTPPPSILR